MELLNIVFSGDIHCGETLTSEIKEYGHHIYPLSSSPLPAGKIDLIITTENHQDKLQRLQKLSENVLVISSNKEIITDIDSLQKQEYLSLYFVQKEKIGYLCGSLAPDAKHNQRNNATQLKDLICDIVVSLSRGIPPDNISLPPCIGQKYYSASPERLRALIVTLLQRLGDQTQGRCATDICFITWRKEADFYTLAEDQVRPENQNLRHFLFNETGILKQNRYAQTNAIISLAPAGDGVLVTVTGDDSRFQRFTDYLDALLSSQNDPATASLVVSPDEIRQLTSFNNTADVTLLSQDIVTLFRRTAAANSALIALHTDEREYSYGELDDASDRMACWLLEHRCDVDGHDVIAVSMQKSALLPIVMLGILKSNKTYVLLDPQAPSTRNQNILDDVQPTLILADTTLQAGDAPCIDPATINYQEMTLPALHLPQQSDSLAYLCYTSGTTGKAKGVMITREGLANVAQNHRDFMRLETGSKVLSIASLGFDAFGWDVYGALISGSTLYLAPTALHTETDALFRYLARHKVNHITITPAILELLPREAWCGLKSMIVMGDAPPADVVAWWAAQTRLCNGYGPTEATIATSLCEYQPGVAWNCIGKPLKNYRCHILDTHNNLQPLGFEGELCIAGHGLARGYLNQPELTGEKFITLDLPTSQGKERIYKTGDIAKWDKQGNIIFVGRKDHQVKIRGVRIEIGEVETAIRTHPQVESVCVVAKPQTASKALVAFVQASSPTLTADALRHSLAPLLHAAAIPTVFVFLPALPLTTNGKVARQQLENWVIEDNDNDMALPETETEVILERIVTEAIGCARADVTQDFICLGAHSLTMSKIVSLVARDLCCRLNIADLFQNNTIRKLAEYIENKSVSADKAVPIGEQRRAALNPQQNLLWYLSALNPDDCSYNLPIAVEIRGPLNLSLFEQAINFIYEKHESLRTQFGEDQGIAYQHALPHIPINLAGHILTGQHPPLEDRVKQLCAVPFDITRHPPVTLRLVQYHDQHHVLVWVKHNILTDAWSEDLILNDLWRQYNHLCSGGLYALPAPEVQTIDIVNDAGAPRLESDIAYWQQKLHACRELDLPLDMPRPLAPTHAGERICRRLDPAIAGLLEQRAKVLGATPFVLLTAALTYLLSKYTNQDDIVIGSAIAARDNLYLEQVSGFHVNTVPLRTVLSAGDTLATLVGKMTETCTGSYRHQQLSFDRILHQLDYERVSNKNPLFQIMAILQNAGDVCQAGLHDCSLKKLPVSSGFSMFDITWNFSLTADGISIELDYASELFHAARLQMMLNNYEQVLHQLLTQSPSMALAAINPLSEAEQSRLLQLASNTTQSARGTLIEQIHDLARRQPNLPAVSCEKESYSYEQLWHLSEHIAHYLSELDSNAFSVGIMMEKSCRVVALILGALKAGKYYIPIDVHYPADRVRYMIDNARTRILVTDEANAALPADCPHATFESILSARPAVEQTRSNREEDPLAYIMYTSGSTGNPKGVMISHSNLNNFTNDFADRLALGPADKMLSLTSISFDIFGLELFCSLVSGAHVVLCPRETAMDPVRLYHFIEQQQPSVIQATPTVWGTIVSHLPAAGSRTLTVLCGGEKMPVALLSQLRRIATQVLQVYGPTETTIWSTCADLTFEGNSTCIGTPINMTEAFIMDSAGGLVPSGTYGELCLGGASVSPGYWNNGVLSAQAFVKRQVLGSVRYLYKTGDIARFDSRGQLEYLGRNDHQVKIRGHRIELSEIDLNLSSMDSIAHALSLIVGEGNNARIVSYLQMAPGAELNEKSVRAALKSRLPNIMIPSSFMVLSAFPLTNNNKIDVRRLPAPTITYSASETDYVPPASEAERAMQEIWQTVLLQEHISVTDSFFSLGGNSLQIPRLLHAIRQAMHISLTIREFILHSQIRELTALMLTKTREEAHGVH
ncbi:Linear gramicidin synthase subunit D [Serratia quinivorans]|nr:Linear gramicidin synthase subunit D [Serratia quinivorans]CAI1839933.1 Linear gramicidin synthase subunit D [Serratia quinivorans]